MLIRMTSEEYTRYTEFRGAEKYAASVRAQDRMFRAKAKELAASVQAFFEQDIQTIAMQNTPMAQKVIILARELSE